MVLMCLCVCLSVCVLVPPQKPGPLGTFWIPCTFRYLLGKDEDEDEDEDDDEDEDEE